AVIAGPTPGWGFGPDLLDQVRAAPLKWYEAERLNIVSLVRQAAENRLCEPSWELATGAIVLFGTRSHYDDWRETHERAFQVSRAADDQRGTAAALLGLGDLNVTQQRYATGLSFLNKALDLTRRIGEWHGYGLVLRKIAYANAQSRDSRLALLQYEEALQHLRAAGDRGAEAQVLRWIGQLHLESDEPELARPYLFEAVTLTSEVGGRSYAQALYRLGELELTTGRVQQAEEIFRTVLTIVLDIGDRRGQAHALYGLGRALLNLRRTGQADLHLHEALSLCRTIGDRVIEVEVLLSLSDLHAFLHQVDRAAARAREAIDICRTISTPVLFSSAVTRLSALAS
ncbi:tetratricopeptide repeat protein, partial [Streptosporangium algeriense]